jgi:hypothetical protein
MKFQFLLTGILMAILGYSTPSVSQTSVPPQPASPTPVRVSSAVPPATASETISEAGIGPAKLGMKLGDLKKQLGASYKFAVKSRFIVDFDALAVSKAGKVQFYILYPAGTTLADSQRIQVLMTDSPAFRTAEGVGAGTLIKEAEAVYGKATLSYNTANESREYVNFAKKTSRKIAFRAGKKGQGFAGVYSAQKAEYNQTTKYVDGAFISSVEVR